MPRLYHVEDSPPAGLVLALSIMREADRFVFDPSDDTWISESPVPPAFDNIKTPAVAGAYPGEYYFDFNGTGNYDTTGNGLIGRIHEDSQADNRVIAYTPVFYVRDDAFVELPADAVDEIAADLDTALTTAHGAGLWGAEGLTPVELIDVADQFTWRLGRRSGGRVTAEEKIYIQVNETARLAFDFSLLLAANVVPNSVVTLALQAGNDPVGVTIADKRVTKQGALAKVTGVTAGEYVVRCKVTTQYGDAIEGDGKLVVVA